MNHVNADPGHFHAVRFYESKESLCKIVAEFLSEGLKAGEPGLVIATPEHRAGILNGLRARKIDVDAVRAAGDLLILDGQDTLDTFMVDGYPQERPFLKTALNAIEQLCGGRRDCRIRAYGEMVDILWKQDRTAAAVRLEVLWNKLAATNKFSLVCGYSMGNFYKDAQFKDICDQHTHSVDAAGAMSPASPTIN